MILHQRAWAMLPALALAILASTPTDATATQARIRALGDGAAYLEDDANVLVWFATLAEHPDRVLLDLGHLDHDAGGSLNRSLQRPGGGLHARLDRHGRWGVVGLYIQESLAADEPGGAITLLGARRFGALTLGARAMLSSHLDGRNATESYGTGESLYFHAFGLSARWHARAGLRGDLAGEVVNTQGDAVAQDLWVLPAQHTWTTWGARTRWFLDLSDTAVLVPSFDHRQDDRLRYGEVIAAPANHHGRRTAAGLGLNLRTADASLIVVSGDISWGKRRDNRLVDRSFMHEYDRAVQTYQQIHARVGLERRVRPWLTLRGALQYWRLQHEHEATRGRGDDGLPLRWLAEQSVEVLTPITLGVGLNRGPFQADLVLNARWTETYGTFPFGPLVAERGTYTGIVLGYHF